MSFLRNRKNQSGIALAAIVISIAAVTAVVGVSLASIFNIFGKDDKKEDKISEIKTKIEQEISTIDIPDDRDGIYDYEIEPILSKYGKVNYNWRKRIKSITTSDGTEIKIKDLYSGKIIKSSTKQKKEAGVYKKSTEIDKPKLGKDMVGVYWSDGEKNGDGTYKASDTSTKIEVTSDSGKFSWSEWYNYVDGLGSTKNDFKLSRWANAKSKIDGSYFVWIPRFEYKI